MASKKPHIDENPAPLPEGPLTVEKLRQMDGFLDIDQEVALSIIRSIEQLAWIIIRSRENSKKG